MFSSCLNRYFATHAVNPLFCITNSFSVTGSDPVTLYYRQLPRNFVLLEVTLLFIVNCS